MRDFRPSWSTTTGLSIRCMSATVLTSLASALRHRSRPGYLAVDGLVACPNAGHDIDVDACYECPMLQHLNIDPRTGVTEVHCRGRGSGISAAWW